MFIKLINISACLLIVLITNNSLAQNSITRIDKDSNEFVCIDSIKFNLIVVAGQNNCIGCLKSILELCDKFKSIDTNFIFLKGFEYETSKKFIDEKINAFLTYSNFNPKTLYLIPKTRLNLYPYIIIQKNNKNEIIPFKELFTKNEITNPQILNLYIND
jgi:hypothetical protein